MLQSSPATFVGDVSFNNYSFFDANDWPLTKKMLGRRLGDLLFELIN